MTLKITPSELSFLSPIVAIHFPLNGPVIPPSELVWVISFQGVVEFNGHGYPYGVYNTSYGIGRPFLAAPLTSFEATGVAGDGYGSFIPGPRWNTGFSPIMRWDIDFGPFVGLFAFAGGFYNTQANALDAAFNSPAEGQVTAHPIT